MSKHRKGNKSAELVKTHYGSANPSRPEPVSEPPIKSPELGMVNVASDGTVYLEERLLTVEEYGKLDDNFFANDEVKTYVGIISQQEYQAELNKLSSRPSGYRQKTHHIFNRTDQDYLVDPDISLKDSFLEGLFASSRLTSSNYPGLSPNGIYVFKQETYPFQKSNWEAYVLDIEACLKTVTPGSIEHTRYTIILTYLKGAMNRLKGSDELPFHKPGISAEELVLKYMVCYYISEQDLKQVGDARRIVTRHLGYVLERVEDRAALSFILNPIHREKGPAETRVHVGIGRVIMYVTHHEETAIREKFFMRCYSPLGECTSIRELPADICQDYAEGIHVFEEGGAKLEKYFPIAASPEELAEYGLYRSSSAAQGAIDPATAKLNELEEKLSVMSKTAQELTEQIADVKASMDHDQVQLIEMHREEIRKKDARYDALVAAHAEELRKKEEESRRKQYAQDELIKDHQEAIRKKDEAISKLRAEKEELERENAEEIRSRNVETDELKQKLNHAERNQSTEIQTSKAQVAQLGFIGSIINLFSGIFRIFGFRF